MIKKLLMMTLEEAIKHCEEKACGNTECAAEHKQLAEWLKELQAMKFLFSNLDEATKEYAETTSVKVWGRINPKKDLEGYMARANYRTGMFDGFKAGAEWMAGQGASFKVKVEEVPQGHWCAGLHLGNYAVEEENALKSINAKDGEEVIVQIRKKQ